MTNTIKVIRRWQLIVNCIGKVIIILAITLYFFKSCQIVGLYLKFPVYPSLIIFEKTFVSNEPNRGEITVYVFNVLAPSSWVKKWYHKLIYPKDTIEEMEEQINKEPYVIEKHRGPCFLETITISKKCFFTEIIYKDYGCQN
jgi:hypothetical protein